MGDGTPAAGPPEALDPTETLATPASEPRGLDTGIHIDTLAVIVSDVVADIQQRANQPELPTGIPALDQAIWGLHRNELTVISARPGEGKTTLALQMAWHIATQGKKVVFLSLEMTREQLVERLLIQVTQSVAWELRVGNKAAVEAFCQKLQPWAETFETINLRVVDRAGKHINEVKHILNEMEETAGAPPDVLIIDFVQLIRADGTMQKFELIGEYLNSLKDLAMRYNMAIVVCSQLNREATKNKGAKPTLANLKGSGSIEELADCVILCWWEELGTEEKPSGVRYWLLVEKQRFGSPGEAIRVNFDKEHLTFHGVEDNVKGWSETPMLPREQEDQPHVQL